MKIMHKTAHLAEYSQPQFTISRTILQKIKDLFQRVHNRYPTKDENTFLDKLSVSLAELIKDQNSPLYGYDTTQLIKVVETSNSVQTIINQPSRFGGNFSNDSLNMVLKAIQYKAASLNIKKGDSKASTLFHKNTPRISLTRYQDVRYQNSRFNQVVKRAQQALPLENYGEEQIKQSSKSTNDQLFHFSGNCGFLAAGNAVNFLYKDPEYVKIKNSSDNEGLSLAELGTVLNQFDCMVQSEEFVTLEDADKKDNAKLMDTLVDKFSNKLKSLTEDKAKCFIIGASTRLYINPSAHYFNAFVIPDPINKDNKKVIFADSWTTRKTYFGIDELKKRLAEHDFPIEIIEVSKAN